MFKVTQLVDVGTKFVTRSPDSIQCSLCDTIGTAPRQEVPGGHRLKGSVKPAHALSSVGYVAPASRPVPKVAPTRLRE